VPAYARRERLVRPRDRALALAAVFPVQGAIGLALISGLLVEMTTPSETVQQLIDVTLPPVPPPIRPREAKIEPKLAHSTSPKPKAASPLAAPQPAHAAPSVASIVPVRPVVAAAGGGSVAGPAPGAGSGAGSGGQGYGAGEGGGTELEQIAGEITPRDYPRHLGDAGIGGRVGVLFTVGVDGRVTRCTVTRSGGIPELDALTCRLIQQRFRYRPSTDRYGRPVSDEVEGEHEWVASRD
jgi:protein TonB